MVVYQASKENPMLLMKQKKAVDHGNDEDDDGGDVPVHLNQKLRKPHPEASRPSRALAFWGARAAR